MPLMDMLNRNYMHDIAGIWIQHFQKSEFSQQKKLETFHMAIAVVAVVANFPPQPTAQSDTKLRLRTCGWTLNTMHQHHLIYPPRDQSTRIRPFSQVFVAGKSSSSKLPRRSGGFRGYVILPSKGPCNLQFLWMTTLMVTWNQYTRVVERSLTILNRYVFSFYGWLGWLLCAINCSETYRVCIMYLYI